MKVSYLTMDSVQEGVGTSQVLPYVVGLGRRGIKITLHTFEQRTPNTELMALLHQSGVAWQPHNFGSLGALSGFARVLRGAGAISGSDVLHARSDLPAAAALLRRHPRWIWDLRSFWIDQRIATGAVRTGSPVEGAMRMVERRAAKASSAVVVLTEGAVTELVARHGESIRDKIQIVRTCVDLKRFSCTQLPIRPYRILLSGSFNALYDRDTTVRFLRHLGKTAAVHITLARPAASSWDESILELGGTVRTAQFADMPALVGNHHVGLSICHSRSAAAISAAMPTKIGEFLASGRPVVVNRGLGDCDRLLTEYRTGVVLAGTSDSALVDGCGVLVEMLNDSGTPSRCRELAQEHFNLDSAVDDLASLYVSLA